MSGGTTHAAQRMILPVAQLGQPFPSAPALPTSLPAVWLAVARVPAAVLPAPAVSGFAVPGWFSHQNRFKLCAWLAPPGLPDPPLVPLLLPPWRPWIPTLRIDKTVRAGNNSAS